MGFAEIHAPAAELTATNLPGVNRPSEERPRSPRGYIPLKFRAGGLFVESRDKYHEMIELRRCETKEGKQGITIRQDQRLKTQQKL